MSYDKLSKENIRDIILSNAFDITGTLYASQNVSNNGEYRIHIIDDMSNVDDIEVYCYCSRTNEKVIVDVTDWDKDNGSLVVDISNLENNCNDFSPRSYMVCVAYIKDGKVYSANFLRKDYLNEVIDPELLKLENRLCSDVAIFNVDGIKVLLTPMYFATGYIYIRVREELLSKKELVTVRYNSVTFKDSFMNVKVRLKQDNDQHFVGFVFSYRYKKSEDRQVYFFDGKMEYEENEFGEKIRYLSGSIDMSKLKLKRIIWDLYPVFEENGAKYAANIRVTDNKIKSVLYNKDRINQQVDCTIKTETGYDVIFPYFTGINTIAFMMREKSFVDSRQFREQEFKALEIYRNNKEKLSSQNIILVYEKYCYSAQDNGFYFFKYCMEHDVEKLLDAKIFYIIDKTSPDYERVKKYESHVLDFLSLEHMVYLLCAKLLVASESKSHSYVWRPNGSFFTRFIKNKKLFFLQHGVIALKKVDATFGMNGTQPVNRFVVSTPQERNIIINNFGYKSSRVCLTGLARWDALVDKSDSYREILVMPTWRGWLDEIENNAFLDSDYFKQYSKLLYSKRLNKLLEDNDLILNFYIHPKFKEYIGNFEAFNNRIKLISYEYEPLNELLMRCKLLITDYSSVCWDVYYMNKPILFYQFDYDLYNKIHGSYLNMEKDLFGYRSTTLDKLLDDFEISIKNNFKQPKEFEEKRKNTFAYTDKNNSARIVSKIKKMKMFNK